MKIILYIVKFEVTGVRKVELKCLYGVVNWNLLSVCCFSIHVNLIRCAPSIAITCIEEY